MDIRRFRGKNSRAAMAQVREALGPEAVILSSRRSAEGVELVAALEFGEEQIEALGGAGPRVAADPARELTMQRLQDELVELRSVLEQQLKGRSWKDSAGVPPVRAAVGQRLARLGLSRGISGSLLDAVPQRGGLDAQWRIAMQVLADRIRTARPPAIEPGEALACVGVTGVGKSTTVAKLAGLSALRHGRDSVALVTADAYRIGADEQLATFARLLGIPHVSATTREALDEALAGFRDRRVFIDTAGMGQRDRRLLDQCEMLAGRIAPVTLCLVLSAAAQAAQTKEVVLAFGRQQLAGAIITKMDEATSLGGVLEALVRTELPALLTCDGQRVPDDIEPAKAGELVRVAMALTDARSRRSTLPGAVAS